MAKICYLHFHIHMKTTQNVHCSCIIVTCPIILLHKVYNNMYNLLTLNICAFWFQAKCIFKY